MSTLISDLNFDTDFDGLLHPEMFYFTSFHSYSVYPPTATHYYLFESRNQISIPLQVRSIPAGVWGACSRKGYCH